MFVTEFFTAPAADDITLSKHSLPVDPSLPAGALHCVQNAARTEPFRVSLVGRIVGMVKRPREEYVILEAPRYQPVQEDFQAFIHALELIPERYRSLFHKRVNKWCQRGRDGIHGLVYTTHAWDLEWIEPSLQADVTALQTGAVVFCVGHLLRIQRPEFIDDEHVHYIIKGDSVTHIHRPTAYKFEEDPEIARFLSTGLLPGAVPKEDEI
ncbi:hypothetical protein C8F01DRAFT_1255442 [Mycena amicta]|nr:hypothetical protein C8F01DRAFT_1255442 [Mycena amicta]